MTTKNKILLQAANVLLCAAIILLTAFFMSGWSVLVQAAFYAVAAAGLAAEAVFLFIKKEILIKLTFIAELIAVVLLSVFVLLGVFADLNAYPTDREKIEAVITLVRSTGEWGMLVFVLIQFLQVVVLPLPAVVCYVPGAVIWSPLTATLLASAGVIAGSFFLLFFGEKIRTKSPRLVGGQGRGGKIRRLHRQSQQGNFSYYADSALFPRRRAVHNRGHNRHELSVLRGGNRIGASADNRGVLLSRQRLDYSVFGLGNTCVARDNRRVCDACRVVLQISEKI